MPPSTKSARLTFKGADPCPTFVRWRLKEKPAFDALKASTAAGSGEVFVKVRVSKPGNAMPQFGDLMGSLGPVKVGSKDLQLEIKDQMP